MPTLEEKSAYHYPRFPLLFNDIEYANITGFSLITLANRNVLLNFHTPEKVRYMDITRGASVILMSEFFGGLIFVVVMRERLSWEEFVAHS